MVPWRKTFYSSCAAQFISMVGFAFVMPFLPFFIVQDLHIPEGAEAVRWSSWLTAALGLPMAIFAFIWGSLADRYGRKMMVLRAMVAGSVVVALMAAVQNAHQLLILRIIQGMLTGTVSASLALVASETPPERSAYALGVTQASAMAGGCFGPLLGGHAAALFGYRTTFLIAAGIIFIGALITHFWTEEHFKPADRTGHGKLGSYRELFATAGFLTVVLVLFQINFATWSPGPVFAYLVKQLSHATDEVAARVAGNLFAVVGIADVLSAIVLGSLADRWGHKRILVLCTFMAGVLSLPFVLAQTIGQLYVLRIVFGLAIGGALPSLFAIIRRTVPEQDIGKAFGVVQCIGGAAFCLGPLTGGYIALAAGKPANPVTGAPAQPAYAEPFLMCGIILILVAVIAAWRVKSAPAASIEGIPEGALKLPVPEK